MVPESVKTRPFGYTTCARRARIKGGAGRETRDGRGGLARGPRRRSAHSLPSEAPEGLCLYVARLMSGDGKQQLGKILLQRKMVSPRDLKSALSEQKRCLTPVPLASKLVDTGKVPEDAALLALSQQNGVPAVDVAMVVIALAHLDYVPRAAAEVLRILPLSIDADSVVLAMANPADKKAIDEIEFATGKAVRPRVALHSPLVAAIAAAYDAKARGERHYRGPKAPADDPPKAGR
jgi:hypothetical protein